MGLLSCCSCKEVVGRIVQQVRAETEQWSEMQQMLEQVRVEMEELRSSRDHWHRRAIASEINFHSQHTQVSSISMILPRELVSKVSLVCGLWIAEARVEAKGEIFRAEGDRAAETSERAAAMADQAPQCPLVVVIPSAVGPTGCRSTKGGEIA